MARKSKLELAQVEFNEAMKRCNERIYELGTHTDIIYDALTRIQALFDRIRNVPSDKKLEYEKLVEIRCNWKKQVDIIQEDYNSVIKKESALGAGGVGLGVSVAALGPTAAMGVATTFGVASTGTAISALSGAAATNAALAWLGGGALAAGGGGMAAGEAFLAMAGPVGWTIAVVALVGSLLLFRRTRKRNSRLEELFTLISIRDTKKYDLATVELNERIRRITYESLLLNEACDIIETFGTDYRAMTEEQQYSLGAYVNLMISSTQLLVNPILGLQPKYTKADLERFVSEHTKFNTMDDVENKEGENRGWDLGGTITKYPDVIISLANLLYKIDFSEDDADILYKSFRKNEDFIKGLNLSKDEFSKMMFYMVKALLAYQYRNKWSLCGNIDGASWNEDTYLLNVAPGIWESNPVMLDGEFKLRFNSSWDDNRGGYCVSEDVAFHAYKDAGNIVPPVVGHVYVIRYNTDKEEIILHDISAE